VHCVAAVGLLGMRHVYSALCRVYTYSSLCRWAC